MAENSDQVVVGADGQVWVAEFGDAPAAPTNATTDPNTVDADYANLGFTSEEGATITDGKTITDIGAWQSFYPIRSIVTARDFMVAFMLRQWNRDTVELALGGTVSGSAGNWTFVPPSPADLDLRVLILDWQDDARSYRLYIPKCMSVENVETNLVRTSAADLPITLKALDPGDGDDVYTLFTNDDAFGPTGS